MMKCVHMSEETIAVQLPIELYERLRQVARAAGETVESAVVRSVKNGMPPSLAKVPFAFHGDLIFLGRLDDQDLWRVATGELPYEKPLTDQQERADFLTLRRSYAFALLKWRGHPVPQPAEFFID